MSTAEYWLLEELIYIECIPLVQECTHCQTKSYFLYQNTVNIFILIMFVLLSKHNIIHSIDEGGLKFA